MVNTIILRRSEPPAKTKLNCAISWKSSLDHANNIRIRNLRQKSVQKKFVLLVTRSGDTYFNNRPDYIYEGSEYTDSKEIADICNKHFVSVGRRLTEDIPDMGESPTAHIKAASKRFAFCKVTTSQAERVMKTLIKSKATRIHNIPNKILKDSYQVIAPFLSEIFNCSISTDVLPDDLKM